MMRIQRTQPRGSSTADLSEGAARLEELYGKIRDLSEAKAKAASKVDDAEARIASKQSPGTHSTLTKRVEQAWQDAAEGRGHSSLVAAIRDQKAFNSTVRTPPQLQHRRADLKQTSQALDLAYRELIGALRSCDLAGFKEWLGLNPDDLSLNRSSILLLTDKMFEMAPKGTAIAAKRELLSEAIAQRTKARRAVADELSTVSAGSPLVQPPRLGHTGAPKGSTAQLFRQWQPDKPGDPEK